MLAVCCVSAPPSHVHERAAKNQCHWNLHVTAFRLATYLAAVGAVRGGAGGGIAGVAGTAAGSWLHLAGSGAGATHALKNVASHSQYVHSLRVVSVPAGLLVNRRTDQRPCLSSAEQQLTLSIHHNSVQTIFRCSRAIPRTDCGEPCAARLPLPRTLCTGAGAGEGGHAGRGALQCCCVFRTHCCCLFWCTQVLQSVAFCFVLHSTSPKCLLPSPRDYCAALANMHKTCIDG